MKVTILGTGTSQGIPIIGCHCQVCKSLDVKDKRKRVSALVEVGEDRILIDIGPDFRSQMLDNGIDHLSGIILTHEHNDHIAGLDDVRPINFTSKKSMPVYAQSRVNKALRTRFDYIFNDEKYPGLPDIQLFDVEDQCFSISKMEVWPIPLIHGQLPILGYRIGDFAYLTDVKTIPQDSLSLLKGLKVLVISCLRKTEHFSHLSLKEALDYIKVINPEQSYLTHLSHQLGFHRDLEKELPQNINVAYDGMNILIK